MNTMISRIATIVRHATAPGEPVHRLSELLKDCMVECGATSGRIYGLRLSPFGYKLLANCAGPSMPEMISASILNQVDRRFGSIVDRVIIERRAVRLNKIPSDSSQFLKFAASDEIQSRLLIPICRRGQCLGLIDLDSSETEHFTLEQQEFVETAAEVALVLLEKDDTLALLKTLPRPVDFRQSSEKFNRELMKLTAEASRMPYIALREWEQKENSLTCLALAGFGETSIDSMSWSPLSQFPSFQRAILQGETVVENSMDEAYLEPMRLHENLHDIRSFVVVPVKVGDGIFGTLSFAAPCVYNYTSVELRSFESLANAVGVSIKNWRNFHAAEAKLFNEAKASAAIGAVEVAQAARHEVENNIHAAQINLRLIVDASRGAPQKSPLADVQIQATKASESLKKALLSADKIKTAARPPKKEYSELEVSEIWERAFDLTAGRLVDNNIKYHLSGKAQTMGYPDWLVHAFLHLLYNSIDAFLERGSKRDRKITVSIDPQGSQSKDIVIRYTDNAGGIDRSKLKPPIPDGDSVKSYIFEKDVTSKESGSGYGMFLVRKLLADHRGSIDLIDYRNGGVVFDLRIPKVDAKTEQGR